MEWYGWLALVMFLIGAVVYVYMSVVKDWLDHRHAKKEIFEFVKSHKRLCTGNNRFVVTVESLQDAFRRYNTTVITNVWLDLVNEHIIVQDPMDQEWCVR